MLNTISVVGSLFFLAAVFPPYNVYIAQAIRHKSIKQYFLIIFFSVLGLSIGSFLVYYGSEIIGFPIELVGGGIIFYLAIKMFLSEENKAAELENIELKENLSGAISCMIMSIVPGAFSISIAKAFADMDYILVALIFLAGPILGTSFGGILLHKGTKISKLPLNKVGSIMLFVISISVFLGYFKG